MKRECSLLPSPPTCPSPLSVSKSHYQQAGVNGIPSKTSFFIA